MFYKEQCHWFTGYKPCKFKRTCVDCPHYSHVLSRIAIISLEAMGAVLRSTCLLKPLRRKYPNAHITWVTLPQSFALLDQNPEIDRLVLLSPTSLPALMRLRFDLVLGVDKSFEAGGLIESLNSRHKLGFGLSQSGSIIPLSEAADYQYSLGLDDHLKFFVNNKPETQQLSETMELEWQRDPYILQLSKQEACEVARRRKLMLTAGTTESRGIIGFNTGCSILFPYKKLRVEKAIELVRVWRQNFPDYCVALLGGREDSERQQQIKSAFNEDPKVIDTPSKEGLRSGIIWMDAVDIVFSGCSLGMHIGIALEKKIIAWFGVSCHQEIDLYDNGLKLLAKVGCSPCWKKSCDMDVKCYDMVDVSEVIDATRSLTESN